jgi:heme oxygenase
MILRALREQTAALHERVERVVGLPTRLAGVAGYADLLGRLYGFVQPVEQLLAGAVDCRAIGLDFEARRKAGHLRDDLTALGSSGATVDALPRCSRLPAVTGAADVFGVMYVMEGSTLGGRVVRRMVADRLGLTPGHGCAYFAGYGDRVGPMWQEFCTALDRFAAAAPAGTGEQIVAAAVGTFDGLGRWLAEGEAW